MEAPGAQRKSGGEAAAVAVDFRPRRDPGRGVRNPGTALDLDWVEGLAVNRSAVERRAATLTTRRTVKQDWQAAWLL